MKCLPYSDYLGFDMIDPRKTLANYNGWINEINSLKNLWRCISHLWLTALSVISPDNIYIETHLQIGYRTRKVLDIIYNKISNIIFPSALLKHVHISSQSNKLTKQKMRGHYIKYDLKNVIILVVLI